MTRDVERHKPVFKKALAKYYHRWERDSRDSAVFCRQRNELGDDVLAENYLTRANQYLNLILDNYDAIEFFSIGDNAHLLDSALPVEYRGYE